MTDMGYEPVTHFPLLSHIAVRAREARAADRGARCMIRSVFFMGFLLIKASWNNSDKPLRNESVNMSHESWFMVRV